MTLPKKVDFYRLPRPVQDRFAAVTRRTAPPAPLLFRRVPRAKVWGYLGASALLAVIASVLLRAGWGNVGSPLALHRTKVLVVDILLMAGAAYGVVHAVAIIRWLESLPYKAGTYLFPSGVIEAHGPVLRVWPMGEVDSIERLAASPGLALRMRDGSRVEVPASSAEEVGRVEAALAVLRPQLMRALAENDTHVVAELDPLHDSALLSPIGPKEAMKFSRPAWVRFDYVLAASMGVILGLALGETRNSTSDQAMFRNVSAAASIPAYQQYLSQGGRHSEEVRDLLLPRAELQEAESKGTVEAVQAFAKAHPDSKIQTEVDAAMRRALAAQFDRAKKAGTITALNEFQKAYPDSKLNAELKAARHALYAKALSDWKSKSEHDPAAAALVEKLLSWAEKSSDPTCEVRFRVLPSKSINDADKKVITSGVYPGVDALPSRYLTADAMTPREQHIAEDVAQGFAASFPADMLSVRGGDRLDPSAPAPTQVPALIIAYAPEWSHSTVVSRKPLTVFAGVDFQFEGSFVVPDATPLAIRIRSWRGAEPWKDKPDDGMSREDYEKKIYDALIDTAFDQLDKKLQSVLF